MSSPGMEWGVPRIMLPPSFWSYMHCSRSARALAGVLFSMIMKTGHPEDSSSNWYTDALFGILS